MDSRRGAPAKRVRFDLCLARRRAIEERRADRAVGRGGGALSLRADRAPEVRTRPPRPLALVGTRFRGGHLPAVRRAGLSRWRDLPAWPRHCEEPRRRARRVGGLRLELPDALPGQLRRHAVLRARTGVSPAPRSAARLELRFLLA